jgi:predicted ester cyclase
LNGNRARGDSFPVFELTLRSGSTGVKGLVSFSPDRIQTQREMKWILIVLVGLSSCDESSKRQDPDRLTPNESMHVQVINRWFDQMWNKGNERVAYEVLDADVIDNDPIQGQLPGPAGVIQKFRVFRSAFPDLHMTQEFRIPRGDLLAVRWRFVGTNTGPFLGRMPTNKRGTMTGIVIYRFAGSQVAEVWEGRNMFELAQQLGLVNN